VITLVAGIAFSLRALAMRPAQILRQRS